MNDITLDLERLGPVPLSYTDEGHGRPVLLLHGGAGPVSVGGFAALLAEALPARVITPVHPGFNGTSRPENLQTMAELAQLYGQLLDGLELTDVTVIGNSMGGWIAAELGLHQDPRVARLVLVDAVGLELVDYPIVDFFSLTMDQVFEHSFFEPAKFRVDVASLPQAQRTAMAANQATLKSYGGTTMADPTLRSRLPEITVPTLVVWGAADRVVQPAHGEVFAEAVAQGEFALIERAGHLPQLETPQVLLELVGKFVG